MTSWLWRWAWAGSIASSLSAGGASMQAPIFHQGMCDASAAVCLNEDLFVVGDDEDNALRVYSLRQPGPPLYERDVSVFLGLRRGAEVDIEASARIGNRIYWLSSHGTNVKGKKRLARQRFFATSAEVSDGAIDLRPQGRPYMNLLQDLIREPRLASFGLAEAASRPPKTPGALSIEGLAAAPGGRLLIGFRNPIPRGRALLVPLLNPADLVLGRPARFGDPVLLDLDGLGIRSIERCGEKYLVVGGTRDGQGDSRLYEWDGVSPRCRLREDVQFGNINPEAIAVSREEQGQAELLVVSDDGTVQIDGMDCKRLPEALRKGFRSVMVHLELLAPPEPTPAAQSMKHGGESDATPLSKADLAPEPLELRPPRASFESAIAAWEGRPPTGSARHSATAYPKTSF